MQRLSIYLEKKNENRVNFKRRIKNGKLSIKV